MTRPGSQADALEDSLHRVARYFYDCVAAQTDWARAVNVLQQKDLLILPLSRRQSERLGRDSALELTGRKSVELGNRLAMLGASASLTLGALFLVGRTEPRGDVPSRPFCAPLLEVPLRLERNFSEGAVVVEPDEESFSVNYGLLAELLRCNNEALQDRLADLAELVPDFPIDAGEFRDFWNGFRMIAPGLDVVDELPAPRRAGKGPTAPEESGTNTARNEPVKTHPPDEREDATKVSAAKGSASAPAATSRGGGAAGHAGIKLVDFYRPVIAKDGRFRLLPATAIILGRRTGHAFSLLEELDGMSRQPLQRTAFASVFGDASLRSIRSNEAERIASDASVAPEEAFALPLTAAQAATVRSARTAPLTVVTGPPGTGKSYTIAAIVLDALLRGGRVLVASQMDKAVEVVAEKVEKIAGPYAIARSGGRRVQRELAKKISRLTGPRSRLKATSNSQRRAGRNRLAELRAQLETLERRYRETVDQERRWSESYERHERLAPVCPLPVHAITPRSFRRAQRAAARAKAALRGEPGLLRRWWGHWQWQRALRCLSVAEDWECSFEELDEALQVHALKQELADIERRLRVPFPADRLWKEVARVEEALTANTLQLLHQNREAALSELTRNTQFRGQLCSFRTSLRRRNRKLKRELLEQVDADVLMQAFPCWASSNRTIGQILPPTPGLFDLVVVDEASQCDLAAAAVALLRGKRAVVVGDPNQLRHVCFLGRAREEASFSRHRIDTPDQHRFRYSRRSLFDVAADAVDQKHFFLLDEHFRSRPHIIDFSNRHFYEGQLRIMTERPRSTATSSIRVEHVRGQRRGQSSVNPAEVDAVLWQVRGIVEQYEHVSARQHDITPPSIGVVSPFRDHIDVILERMLKEFSSSVIERHGVVAGTAHSLQGDEKDIVIFTTSIAPGFHTASLRFLENPNLFNVAITRARRLLIVVTSVTSDMLPAGPLREYFIHASGCLAAHTPMEVQGTRFEQSLASGLSQRGFELWPKFHAAGLAIDLVAGNGGDEGHLAILCDGPRIPAPDGRLPQRLTGLSEVADDPLTCQRILQRAGWMMRRVPYRSWLTDSFACLEHVSGAFGDSQE